MILEGIPRGWDESKDPGRIRQNPPRAEGQIPSVKSDAVAERQRPGSRRFVLDALVNRFRHGEEFMREASGRLGLVFANHPNETLKVNHVAGIE